MNMKAFNCSDCNMQNRESRRRGMKTWRPCWRSALRIGQYSRPRSQRWSWSRRSGFFQLRVSRKKERQRSCSFREGWIQTESRSSKDCPCRCPTENRVILNQKCDIVLKEDKSAKRSFASEPKNFKRSFDSHFCLRFLSSPRSGRLNFYENGAESAKQSFASTKQIFDNIRV